MEIIYVILYFSLSHAHYIRNLSRFAKRVKADLRAFYMKWYSTKSYRCIINAMVTNHLRASYGVYFNKYLTILRRPYGTGRRQKESYDFYQCLDILWCPAKFRYMYYLKFHGARTAFGMVIEGEMTSAGHRTTPGWRLHSSDRHRTIFV